MAMDDGMMDGKVQVAQVAKAAMIAMESKHGLAGAHSDSSTS